MQYPEKLLSYNDTSRLLWGHKGRDATAPLFFVSLPRILCSDAHKGHEIRMLQAVAEHCRCSFRHISDQATTLNPIIDRMSVVMKKMRQNVAGSLKNTIPTITAPTAPIPVHTG